MPDVSDIHGLDQADLVPEHDEIAEYRELLEELGL